MIRCDPGDFSSNVTVEWGRLDLRAVWLYIVWGIYRWTESRQLLLTVVGIGGGNATDGPPQDYHARVKKGQKFRLKTLHFRPTDAQIIL